MSRRIKILMIFVSCYLAMADFMTSDYANYYFEKASIMMKFVHPKNVFHYDYVQTTNLQQKRFSNHMRNRQSARFNHIPRGALEMIVPPKIISKVQKGYVQE